MSALKKFLSKAAMDFEDLGPRFGELAARAGRRLGELSVEHPKTAATIGTLGPYGLGVGGGLATEGLDEALTGDKDADIPMDMQDSMRLSGLDPKDYEYEGRHPLSGAGMGASLGLLLHSAQKAPGPLAKYLAIGALAGGGLGSLSQSYRRKKKDD